MISNIRAKHPKANEIINNRYELAKNKLIQIDSTYNNCTFYIHERSENESLLIHSSINDKSDIIIGNEFQLNFIENSKKVDLSLMHLSTNKKVTIYLYDMKKTFAGIDTIIKLIEQWKQSIIDMEYCVSKLDAYSISSIQIGVVTEDNDIERRRREILPILNNDTQSDSVPSFIKSKHNASKSSNIAKAKVLEGFLDGNITIRGVTYKYDIRIFQQKKCHMYFNDGILQ